ncbi:Calcineurin-like phosphoesterase [Caloramator mitchellensis]|uniref:Calcineurin-like phosphoesterase n=1 Tax=Caloramator mitchellensis TaxID=908809 RepID=A0A0R3K4U6_CALMK|nr:metallophosphoesterase [Caloramator mitchellensis]KRQ87970.1 Calcineurin-like phosphoesterase [Caloramator mitchellensis]
MAIYALSDLHLSFASDKPMNVFGEMWEEHFLKIQENWNSKIEEDDLVLIAGDISWALKLDEALPDLEFIHNLRGKKVLIKGNHDYWWTSITKLNSLYDDMYFIQNTSYTFENYSICGTRGWINIDDKEEKDVKIYNRELIRLKLSLESAKESKKIVMMHYPPITKISKAQEFIDVLKENNVEKIIYGHIHYDARHICFNGIYEGIEFICSSADIINFDPIRII